MNRVEALILVANDASRSVADRDIALKSLRDISNNSPDERERQAARRALPDPGQVDSDLERALNSESFSGYREYSDYVNQLPEDTRQLLSDINSPLLIAIPPFEGGTERLKDLYARSQSPLVKSEALEAIETTERLLSKGLKMIPRPIRKAEVANVAA